LDRAVATGRRSDIAALSAHTHWSVAARQGVAWHVAPGGVKALTGEPRRGIEEADKWDPAVEIFRIKNTSKTKIAQ
jgi:hypothetical protein